MSKGRRKPVTKLIRLPPRYAAGWQWSLKLTSTIGQVVYHERERLLTDLGGEEALSAQKIALVDRAVFYLLTLRQHESAVLGGRESTMDLSQYVQATHGLVALLRAVGLERQARDVPSLADLKRAAEAVPE